ncbi:MAG TPA: glucose 1-dehydrogenase [Terriglobales bacterium]|jgi:NAD(P)-dependent dehydrogenase (short-subunit alcohol dehydrogenase family)|nr:glucose 1-dehydrogenase [Terriglobales bacterium]
MDRLQGKVAFITGAGAGIGRAGAQLFAKEGAKIAVVDINKEGGDETVGMINDDGGEAVFIHADMTEPEAVERAVKTAVERFGKLDILYNNAGASTTADGPVTRVSLDEWWRAIRVNLFSVFLGCKYAIPELIRNGGGSVINTASIGALFGNKNGRNAYAAAKGGVVSLTRAIAVDYAEYRVRANALAPTVILTERIKKFFDDPKFAASGTSLLGFGEPRDVAHLAVYLASDESRLITGVVFPVDSGWSAV